MKRYIAIDLGASNGRHIVGWMDKGEIVTQKVYGFENGVKSTKYDFTTYALGEEPNYTFYLGATNRNGAPASTPRLIIFAGEFYLGGQLVRNYLPCFRKSDNKLFQFWASTGKILGYRNRGIKLLIRELLK